MTGEVFGALKDHTILGRLMRDGASDAKGFARGVREGAALGSAGALLNRRVRDAHLWADGHASPTRRSPTISAAC